MEIIKHNQDHQKSHPIGWLFFFYVYVKHK